ncbi:hypothetical protein BCR39DRAFT_546355 [Naematelia encephala]|uniref:Uncharacterized protein n=1 Tax=Naematelia encephala TaxID=71784 RepID=A0A1Y2AQF2_9TREE|nr:hypothetical protein BCR39DRAFT_546355 [Naematelia encephala]
MMPKHRAYSRRELELLRRADLQNLYKIHGLKGANQKSDVLVEHLVKFFSSPAFTQPSSGSPGPGRKVRRLRTIEPQPMPKQRLVSSGMKHAREMVKVAEVALVKQGSQSGEAEMLPIVVPMDMGVDSQPLPISMRAIDIDEKSRNLSSRIAHLETLPSSSTSSPPELDRLRADLADVRATLQSGFVSLAQVEDMLHERDAEWAGRLKAVEDGWALKLQDVEATWEQRWRRGIGGSEAVLTETAPAGASRGGKRTRSSSVRIEVATPRKRARTEPLEGQTVADETRSIGSSEPHTPSPAKSIPLYVFKTPLALDFRHPTVEPVLPRTPSPSHQGIPLDNSRTPVVSDFFAPPPPFASSSKQRGNPSELPYPVFTTTPKPSEPTSPTLDAPPSASRARANLNHGFTSLTPGRLPTRAQHAPRAVSEAHVELATITESPENPVATSFAQRRVTSLDTRSTPTKMFPGGNLGSPSRLSPSPSIGDSDGFRYTPFPAPPRSAVKAQRPAVQPGEARNEEPAREYMSIALHGLENRTDSPSALATPGHRTLLGTERYRDTRFGDVPMLQWGTPGVDIWGSGTPGR